MEDFFKQFKSNWEGRPEPPFDERDWEAMQNELEGAPQKRRYSGFGWWTFGAPVILLLSVSNLAFFWEWKAMRQAINVVENQRDTVWLNCVEYQTDTITIFRDRPVGERAAYLTTSGLFYRPIVSKPQVLDLIPNAENQKNGGNSASSGVVSENSSAEILSGALAPQNLDENRKHWPQLLPLNPSLNFSNATPIVELPGFAVPTPVALRKKSLKQALYALRPKDIAVGIEASLSYPVQEELKPLSGFGTGITASVGFASNIRLWGNAAYATSQFVTDRMGEDIGIPVIQPPSDDFVFQEAEARFSSFQFGLGIDYQFGVKSRIKPLLGIGIGQMYRMPDEIIYDFAKASEGIEWSVDRSFGNQGNAQGYWTARGGLDYAIFGRWHWQLMVAYQKPMHKTTLFYPQMVHLQTGLLYHF